MATASKRLHTSNNYAKSNGHKKPKVEVKQETIKAVIFEKLNSMKIADNNKSLLLQNCTCNQLLKRFNGDEVFDELFTICLACQSQSDQEEANEERPICHFLNWRK